MANEDTYDWAQLVAELNQYLRLKTTVTGMQRFARIEDLEGIKGLRRPQAVHTMDQIVAMGARLGWTVGATAQDLVGQQCRTVVGLQEPDPEWLSGKAYVGVWHATVEDARGRQAALTLPSSGHAAVVVSPLASGRLPKPDICLIYGTPGQMITLINALQWKDYRPFNWSVVGETSCADSWGRALATDEPSLSLPCYAERRYGGVPDEEMLMALPPRYLPIAIEGLKALSANGLRYPIAPYGIQQDVRQGMAVSYAKTDS